MTFWISVLHQCLCIVLGLQCRVRILCSNNIWNRMLVRARCTSFYIWHSSNSTDWDVFFLHIFGTYHGIMVFQLYCAAIIKWNPHIDHMQIYWRKTMRIDVVKSTKKTSNINKQQRRTHFKVDDDDCRLVYGDHDHITRLKTEQKCAHLL